MIRQTSEQEYLDIMRIVGEGADKLLAGNFADSDARSTAISVAWAAWKRLNPPPLRQGKGED